MSAEAAAGIAVDRAIRRVLDLAPDATVPPAVTWEQAAVAAARIDMFSGLRGAVADAVESLEGQTDVVRTDDLRQIAATAHRQHPPPPRGMT